MYRRHEIHSTPHTFTSHHETDNSHAYTLATAAPSFVSLEADVDGEEDYAATSDEHELGGGLIFRWRLWPLTSNAKDDDFFEDNVVEPDDNVDASGSDDNDASDIKKYLRAN